MKCIGNIFRFMNKYLKFIYLKYPFSNILKLKDMKINLAHSLYQHSVLKSKNIKSLLLSDFIEDEFFESAERLPLKEKKI